MFQSLYLPDDTDENYRGWGVRYEGGMVRGPVERGYTYPDVRELESRLVPRLFQRF